MSTLILRYYYIYRNMPITLIDTTFFELSNNIIIALYYLGKIDICSHGSIMKTLQRSGIITEGRFRRTGRALH